MHLLEHYYTSWKLEQNKPLFVVKQQGFKYVDVIMSKKKIRFYFYWILSEYDQGAEQTPPTFQMLPNIQCLLEILPTVTICLSDIIHQLFWETHK